MVAFDPTTLARWSAGRWTSKPAAAISGFAIDSRHLRAGDLFVALKTEKRDGHAFLSAAAQAGAVAALVAEPDSSLALPQLVVADPLRAFQVIAREHRLTFTGPVVGVTGSAGKTSTKNLLARLLGPNTLATEGNLNNFLGVPLTLAKLDPAQHRFAVIEAGISEPGEMATLAGMIQPDVAVVTLVAPAHTESLGGIEGVAREKSVLPASVRTEGVMVLPRSVAGQAAFQALRTNRIVVEPVDALDDAREGSIPFVVRHDGETTALLMLHPAAPGSLELTLPRVSSGMAQNVALAAATALWLGISTAEVRARLQGFTPAPLRGEVRRVAGRLLYLDCYNANPASMADALSAFAEIAPAAERRLYVLGGMEELGADSARYHETLGRSVRLGPSDHACLIGREAESLRVGMIGAGARADQIEIVESTGPIVERLRSFHGAVFVKGSRKYRLEEILVGLEIDPSTLGTH